MAMKADRAKLAGLSVPRPKKHAILSASIQAMLDEMRDVIDSFLTIGHLDSDEGIRGTYEIDELRFREVGPGLSEHAAKLAKLLSEDNIACLVAGARDARNPEDLKRLLDYIAENCTALPRTLLLDLDGMWESCRSFYALVSMIEFAEDFSSWAEYLGQGD